MSEYIQNLNPTQRDAAVNYQGASLIIAGAGSGKTRVLTCRIAYMRSRLRTRPPRRCANASRRSFRAV